jgi:hypothetical protein
MVLVVEVHSDASVELSIDSMIRKGSISCHIEALPVATHALVAIA